MSGLPTLYQEFIHLSRYSRWLQWMMRRESWFETVTRYMDFMRKHLKDNCGYEMPDSTYNEVRSYILGLKVMPSMRALMTAGEALRRENLAAYNCAFQLADSPRSLDEMLYVLLNGVGEGFSVERHSDDIRVKYGKLIESRVWRSTASPFFMWMKKALLGLSAIEKKKEVPIKSDWILKMPPSLRVAFIQGLADGDGYASIRAFVTAIATKTNKQFINDLLASVGISSTIKNTKVLIKQHSEILKAGKLPLFRFATGCQKRLEDLSEVIRNLDRGHGRVPAEHLRIIDELQKQGYTPGQIAEILWYKHGIPRSTSSIERIIQRKKKSLK